MTQSLGGTDASCAHLQGASPQVVRNCAASGLAESPYPPSSFGTDTHVDTGITDPASDLASILQEMIGGLYTIIAHVLTWVILGLGLAFGFDLFASDKSGQIPHGLASALNLFTFALLPLAIVVGGIVGLSHWFGRRAESRAVIHWGAMLALMGLGLIVAQNPVGALGWVDQTSNGLTSGALSAFTGSGGGTGAGFANATPGLYRTTMEEPWCAMEFGNVSWCMAPIDARMAVARQSVIAHIDKALGDQGDPALAKQQAPLEIQRLHDARTNGELFLSFIPNSDARNGKTDSWTLYSALLKDRPDLAAIRGPGGVWERLGIFFLSGIAGIFFLALILYIAWEVIVSSAFFVIALLLAPVAILTPAFGETGRGVFVKWLILMVASLFKRVIFAIYLGVMLLTTNVFLAIGPQLGGWLIEWLILAAIWAMALFYRHKILKVMTGGLYDPHAHPAQRIRSAATGAAAAYAWKRAPQRVASTTQHDHHYESNDQHVHVHVNGNGNGHMPDMPVPVPNLRGTIEGRAREIEE